jgi:hypothetical protein
MRRSPAGWPPVTNLVTTPDGLPRLLTDEEMAVILRCSAAYLRKDRIGPRRIPFVKLGHLVRYDPVAVRAAIACPTV